MRFGPLILTALMAMPLSSTAQDELPGPPSDGLADPEEHAEAPFGTDVSASVAGGTLLGSWTVPGVHTVVGIRFEAFARSVATPGPRLGLSLFGEQTLGLLPEATEEQEGQDVSFPFQYLHYGALCVFRTDASLPWGGNAGLGFSRMDLEPYYNGTYPIPVMLFEGGVRRHLGGPQTRLFLDLGLRAGWSELRNPAEELEELFLLQLAVSVGAHVR